MPKKARYSKDEILEVAFQLVRQKGFSALSARSLAKELSTSTAPIFTAFESIEAVQESVFARALGFYYEHYLKNAISTEKSFKKVGIQLVEFAKNEKELFKLIFMNNEGKKCGRSNWRPPEDEFTDRVIESITEEYPLTREKAKKLYNQISIYTYGLAVLFAEGDDSYNMEDISALLTGAFNAFYGALNVEEGEKNDT